jgi:hypothetical protein
MPYKDPEMYKKSQIILRWKRKGLIDDDYEIIYQRWLDTTHCDYCNIELVSGQKGLNRKCMDHEHNTGKFRGICCHKCNMNQPDVKVRSNSVSQEKYIEKTGNTYRYRKTGQSGKSFKTLKEAIDYRNEQEKKSKKDNVEENIDTS